MGHWRQSMLISWPTSAYLGLEQCYCPAQQPGYVYAVFTRSSGSACTAYCVHAAALAWPCHRQGAIYLTGTLAYA